MNNVLRLSLIGLFVVICSCSVVGIESKDFLLDSINLSNEIAPRMKKPFCNAFTGCGKKRSYETPQEDSNKYVTVKIPMFIYQALAKIALENNYSQNDSFQNELDNANGNTPNLNRIDLIYKILFGKSPMQKHYSN